jgi:protein-L-isoaspartate(D-aspartate) O-methyltransferase
MGWPEKGPYDGILVTAAPRVVPDELLEQLAVGGRMVLPVGDGEVQELVLLRRTEDGIRRESLGRVRFVPLLGGVLR